MLQSADESGDGVKNKLLLAADALDAAMRYRQIDIDVHIVQEGSRKQLARAARRQKDHERQKDAVGHTIQKLRELASGDIGRQGSARSLTGGDRNPTYESCPEDGCWTDRETSEADPCPRDESQRSATCASEPDLALGDAASGDA
mmetsp:Transcript_37879/g.100801  ORF Transcript_37879/g.100801 Transcript_37879/m.100801 type:complete len:145 (-) Transcript_37879:306-740(-)